MRRCLPATSVGNMTNMHQPIFLSREVNIQADLRHGRQLHLAIPFVLILCHEVLHTSPHNEVRVWMPLHAQVGKSVSKHNRGRRPGALRIQAACRRSQLLSACCLSCIIPYLMLSYPFLKEAAKPASDCSTSVCYARPDDYPSIETFFTRCLLILEGM